MKLKSLLKIMEISSEQKIQLRHRHYKNDCCIGGGRLMFEADYTGQIPMLFADMNVSYIGYSEKEHAFQIYDEPTFEPKDEK